MIIYFIKSFICMGISFGLYRLLLAKYKSFFFNRFFMLLSVVASALVPLVPSSVTTAATTIDPFLNGIITKASTLEQNYFPIMETPDENIYMLSSLIPLIYFVITTFVIFYFLFSIFQLIQLVFNCPVSNFKGMRIIVVDDTNTPFSFFNRLFISSQMHRSGIPLSILHHEICHARHYHSLDRLICQVIFIFHWWNPFFLLLRNDLKANHEYTADNFAINQISCKDRYITFLLKGTSLGQSHQFLQIGFFQSSISKRLTMIYSPSRKPSFIIVSIVMLINCLMIISCTNDHMDEQLKFASDIETVSIHMPGLNSGYIYPVEIARKAENMGYKASQFLLEYRGPGKALYHKFSTDSNFEIRIDYVSVDQNELSAFSNIDFVAFRVVDISKLENSKKYRADLFTKEGYFAYSERMIEQVKKRMGR